MVLLAIDLSGGALHQGAEKSRNHQFNSISIGRLLDSLRLYSFHVWVPPGHYRQTHPLHLSKFRNQLRVVTLSSEVKSDLG